jgi:hypothetical protein
MSSTVEPLDNFDDSPHLLRPQAPVLGDGRDRGFKVTPREEPVLDHEGEAVFQGDRSAELEEVEDGGWLHAAFHEALGVKPQSVIVTIPAVHASAGWVVKAVA